MQMKVKEEVAQLCPTLCNSMDPTVQNIGGQNISRPEYWSG